MNYFKEEISPNQPSIRIGDRLPENSVNLAYINGPKLLSADAVEVYDYASRVASDTVVVEDFKGEFYVGSNRVLISKTNSQLVPIENAIVTNYYKELPDGTWIPLYYTYTSRFKHYEDWDSSNAPNGPNENERVYTGHNIRVLFNNKPTSENYIITLQQDGPSEDHTWRVRVYSEFTSTADKFYMLEYSKWDQGIAVHNFEELYNSRPFFTKTDKETILAANDGDTKYALEKVLAEDGYRVYVAEDTDPLDRNPVIFRWRIIDGNGIRSTWKSEILYRLQTMYDEDFQDLYDTYVLEDGVAKKVLCDNVATIIPNSITPYTEEHQIWNGTEWVEDITTKANLDIDASGRLTAYTQENTGDKIDQPGVIAKEYPLSPIDFTIEEWLEPWDVQVTPAVTTNHSKTSRGATISTTLNTGLFPNYSNPENCIDGINPYPFIYLGYSNGAFSVRSNETPDPPMDRTVINVALSQPRTIHTIEVVMGARGNLVKLEVKKSDSSIQTIWAEGSVPNPDYIWWSSGRHYSWSSGDWNSIADVTNIIVTVEPTKWLTRDYGWLLNLFGIRDTYQTGFDVYEINAYSTTDPPDVITQWNDTKVFSVNLSKSNPNTLDLGAFLASNGLVPDGVTKENLHYRITLGDKQNGDGYDPTVTMTLFKNNVRVNAEGALDSIVFNYNDFAGGNSLSLSFTAQKEDALYSRKFSVKTRGDGKIFLMKLGEMGKDEMWLPKINNGRMTRKNYIEDTILDYYLPEYGAQPFYPEQPYMYIEKEEAKYVDGTTINVKHRPMYVTFDSNGVPTNLFVYIESEGATPVRVPLEIVSWNMYTGDIKVDRKLTLTDRVFVDYYYECPYLIYKGYYDFDSTKFFCLDLNPMPGHIYMDNDGEIKPSSELMTKSIYFYLLPTFTYNYSTGAGSGATSATIRHLIFDRNISEIDAFSTILSRPECQGGGVIILGRIDIKRPAVPSMIEVTDSRRRGGGFKDKYTSEAIQKIHSDMSFIWDVGTWDGLPYPSNGVIEVTVPRSLLKENGGKFTEKEILDIINQHVAFGVYVFIQYK